MADLLVRYFMIFRSGRNGYLPENITIILTERKVRSNPESSMKPVK